MISYAPEVKAALDAGRPVVALETTIVTHGMPYPINVRTARSLEDIIRAEGAVPATIAIMDGTILIGITDLELERLAHAGDVRKLSRADLADALVKRQLGATTVAATMLIAARAGIRVFATGGIGGKELTPFLLGDVLERTGGRSLTANVALVENNARLAARIARAMTAA